VSENSPQDDAIGSPCFAKIDITKDAVDGVVPRDLFFAAGTDDVVEVLREARSRSLALLARGGGSHLALGNPPRKLDTIVALDRMNRVLDRSRDDMIVTVEAGMTLSELDGVLADAGQRCGLSAWESNRATVGGVVATNTTGSRAHGFGFPRDQVLGMRAVDGGGRVLRCGGKVVKNVAGYDLPRLFAGSFGTLGIMTEVTLRTHPTPEATVSLRLDAHDSASLKSDCAALFESRLPLSALLAVGVALPDQPASWCVLVILEGTRQQVESMHGTVKKLCAGTLTAVESIESVAAPDLDEELILRIHAPPGRAIDTARSWLDSARKNTEPCRVLVDFAGAAVRLFTHPESTDVADRLIESASAMSGSGAASLIVEAATPGTKSGRDVWGPSPSGIEIMRRLKDRFDPSSVLAPGRFVGGI
jgi:glycolate oxidase FAD binding subunit